MNDKKLLEEAYKFILKEQYNKSRIDSSISDIKQAICSNTDSTNSDDFIVNTFIRTFKPLVLRHNFQEGERKCVIIELHRNGVINNKQCSDLLKYFSHEDRPDFRRF